MRKLLAQVKRKADLDTLAIQGGSTALARAAYGFGDPDGHVECVRMLLKAGADPNVKSVEEPRDTALHGACKNGAAIGVIAALVNAGADVHSRDDAGSTPLQNVVFDHPHSEATIRLLVLAGADMECRNKSGHRILDYCADRGSEINARTLIELGADTSPVVVTEISKLLHMLGHTETTYLHMAASKNAVGILRDAHRAGVDLFHKLPGGTHRTPLHAAVMCNSVEAAAFILESVPPAKAKRLVDEPALINCFRSRAALAPTLFQQFIHDPEQAKAAVASYVAQIESSEYDTSHQPLVQSPLAVAVDSGYPAMVRLLLKHGANPDQLEGTGKPVLAHALVSANMGKGQASWEFAKDWHEFGRTNEEQSVLVHPKLRADKKAKGNEPFNTLFEQSPAAKFFKIARKLIRSGATLTGFDGYGYTMMHNACNCGDLKVMRMIIERTGGAEVNTVTSKDCEYKEYAHRRSTPLHLVVRIDAMADLLNTNDDVVGMAARDEAGIIDLLLANGAAATIDAKDHDGETPLIAALKNEYPRYDSIMALLKGGADVTIPDSDGETPLQLFKAWWKARGRRIAESGAWIGQHGQEEGHFKGKALALIPSAAWDSERAGEVLSALKAK